MAISYKKARGLVGKKICCHMHSGHCHYGVVRKVTPQGMYMERQGGFYRQASGEAELDAMTTENLGEVQGEQVFFGLFFLPFLAVTAVSAFAGGFAGGYAGSFYGRRRGFYW